MSVDLNSLARQFRGRKFAELILHHVKNTSNEQTQAAIVGLMNELRSDFSEPVLKLIDFLSEMPPRESKGFFGGDCGDQFVSLIDMTRGFLEKKHGLNVSDSEAFTIFNIIVQNYVYSCQSDPQTKAAMQKAAGVGLFGRMFGR